MQHSEGIKVELLTHQDYFQVACLNYLLSKAFDTSLHKQHHSAEVGLLFFQLIYEYYEVMASQYLDSIVFCISLMMRKILEDRL